MPNREFFRNLAGLDVDDYEMMVIPRPVSELTIHVTFKTVQLGALLGSLCGPVYQAVRTGGQVTKPELVESATKTGLYGAGIGLLLGPVVTYLAVKDMSNSEIMNRCYRLRFDRKTLISDRLTAASACLGSVIYGKKGFVFGVDAGFLIGEILGLRLSDY